MKVYKNKKLNERFRKIMEIEAKIRVADRKIELERHKQIKIAEKMKAFRELRDAGLSIDEIKKCLISH